MQQENEFNTGSLYHLAIKWRWHLIAIAIISGLAATVFSSASFIEPKFKSTAVVYPVNIVPYSNESATEQLLQLFQSADVKFESVNIEILDKDPIKACAIVNELITETNLKLRQLQREKSQEMHSMYAKQLELKKQEIDTLKVQISKLRVENNIIDVYNQTREITRGVINSKGGEASKISSTIQEKGAELTSLNTKLDAAPNAPPLL